MNKKLSIKTMLVTALVALTMGVTLGSAIYPTPAAAAPADQIQRGVDGAGGVSDMVPLQTRIRTIVNILLFIIGVVSVIVIIIGAFRFVVSGGDAGGVKNAKNTILYAVIGLVVAILGYAIVNFVVSQF